MPKINSLDPTLCLPDPVPALLQRGLNHLASTCVNPPEDEYTSKSWRICRRRTLSGKDACGGLYPPKTQWVLQKNVQHGRVAAELAARCARRLEGSVHDLRGSTFHRWNETYQMFFSGDRGQTRPQPYRPICSPIPWEILHHAPNGLPLIPARARDAQSIRARECELVLLHR